MGNLVIYVGGTFSSKMHRYEKGKRCHPTPKKEKTEDESYPIYVGIQLEFANDQWLISQVWEDV